MSKDLIDEHISAKQCKKAIEALHAYQTKKDNEASENELLPGKEQYVWLVVGVKKMYPERKLKPFKIPIAHPLVDPRTSSVCLITKDPQREYKDLLEKHEIKFISRVVGITKLKGKFKPYDARRQLLQENGLFLADDRVIPLLPKLLGKKWFDAKKQPIPVCLTRKDLKGELERAISSTYMHQNRGTCTSVKIGAASQSPAQILDNLKLALPAIVKNIKGEWDNIQSFMIKTNSSASLPIWNCNLDGESGGRWDGFTVQTDVEGSANGSGDEEKSESKDGDGAGNEGEDIEDEEEDIEDEEEKPVVKAKGKRSIKQAEVKSSGKSDAKDDTAPGTKTKKIKKVVPPSQKSEDKPPALTLTSTSKTKTSTKDKLLESVQKASSKPHSSTRAKKNPPPTESTPLEKKPGAPETSTSTSSKKSKTSKPSLGESDPVSSGKKSNKPLSETQEAALVSSVKSVSLTPNELKQKRVSVGGDKKKDKLLSKVGKVCVGEEYEGCACGEESDTSVVKIVN